MAKDIWRRTAQLFANWKTTTVAIFAAAIAIGTPIFLLLTGLATAQSLAQAGETAWNSLATPWFSLLLIAFLGILLHSGLKDIAEAEKLGELSDEKYREQIRQNLKQLEGLLQDATMLPNLMAIRAMRDEEHRRWMSQTHSLSGEIQFASEELARLREKPDEPAIVANRPEIVRRIDGLCDRLKVQPAIDLEHDKARPVPNLARFHVRMQDGENRPLFVARDNGDYLADAQKFVEEVRDWMNVYQNTALKREEEKRDLDNQIEGQFKRIRESFAG